MTPVARQVIKHRKHNYNLYRVLSKYGILFTTIILRIVAKFIFFHAYITTALLKLIRQLEPSPRFSSNYSSTRCCSSVVASTVAGQLRTGSGRSLHSILDTPARARARTQARRTRVVLPGRSSGKLAKKNNKNYY